MHYVRCCWTKPNLPRGEDARAAVLGAAHAARGRHRSAQLVKVRRGLRGTSRTCAMMHDEWGVLQTLLWLGHGMSPLIDLPRV